MNEVKDEIKETLLSVALKRFEHYGYNKTTVEEIAEDAHIGKGSFYLHFKSKKEIFLHLVELHFSTKLKEIENAYHHSGTIKERLNKMIISRYLNFYEYWTSKPHGYEIGQVVTTMSEDFENVIKPYRDQADDFILKLIEEGNREQVFEVKNPTLVAKTISMSFMNLLPSGYKCFSHFNEAKEYVYTLLDIIYRGLQKK